MALTALRLLGVKQGTIMLEFTNPKDTGLEFINTFVQIKTDTGAI